MEERAKFILAGYGFVLTVLLINLKLIYDGEVAGYQERIKNFTGDDESKKIPKIQCVMTFFIKFLAKNYTIFYPITIYYAYSCRN